jgi:uncharacterized membrane protein
MNPNQQLLWHRLFQAGVLVKALDGVLEIIGAAVLLVTTPAVIQGFVRMLTHEELIEDPHDPIANLIVHMSHGFSIRAQYFAGAYLLAHGLIKVGLTIGLLRGVLWVYPAALLFLVTFVFYQVDCIVHTHSVTLALLTVFDLLVVVLIWHEWRRARFKAGF